jgi:hydroxymethylpyrimidine/phosphomethylpyrimidine kinase
MRTALTIAGSDPTGGAGIQADLKTFAAFDVYGTSIVTAVTAQNTSGITTTEALAADLVTAQLETIAADVAVHATKTGMLANAAIVEAVAAAIEDLRLPLLVVDPVLVSSSGTHLLDDDGVEMLRRELVPRAAVVTPNLPEAEALSGQRIASPDDVRSAARRIRDLGAQWVIVTGGHGSGRESIDVVFDGRTFTDVRTARIPGEGIHGTGCAYASAVAAGLALGLTVVDAARLAQAYVAGGIRHALAIGRGATVIDHFWQGRTPISG